MKKVLILTYYWPPSGGAGVQRWLKFVKYIHKFGWTPVVYTADGGEMPVVDDSLAKDIPEGTEVLKLPVWEPYSFYKRITGQKQDQRINSSFVTESKKPRLTEKMAVWVRGNFFIPDARRYWLKPSVKFLSEYLSTNPVDIIVSSGPPHTMHLIANELKKRTGLPWVADFRDPWTNIDFYKELMLTSFADKKHKRLEKMVLGNADTVISIGKTLAEELKVLGAKDSVVITNGYDSAEAHVADIKMDEKFTIAHIGTMAKARNAEVLWIALSKMIKSNHDIKIFLEIKLIGKVDLYIIDRIANYGLSDFVKKTSYMPHEEVIAQQQASQVLLLVLNRTHNAKGILTGKFFEYMASGRPIIMIGPPMEMPLKYFGKPILVK